MSNTVYGSAHGKINLHLSVTGKRPDGYHSIVSLFQQVSLHDEISVRSLKDDMVIIVGNETVSPENDLMNKAALLMKMEYGISSGVEIRINKRIPSGAGLGGGSSDAACVLRALDMLWEPGSQSSTLSSLAGQLGSDVPFFINSAAALVSGRGERIESVEARDDYIVLLVNPGFPVSTAEAYRWIDEECGYETEGWKIDFREIKRRYHGFAPETWDFTNSFSEPLMRRYPRIHSIMDMLTECGSLFSSISGSGSTIFGIFRDVESAEKAKTSVHKEYWAEIVSPLARNPSIVLQ